MASGHRHHHHRPLPKRLLILITPAAVETITRWVAAAIINRTFDIPLTAAASVDHLTVYLSRLLQERLTEPVSGISFDPARTLAWHELAELFFMTVDGCSYDDAHHIATIAFEKVAAERLGLNWEGYCRLFDGLVEKIEKAPIERCPRDLVMTPYTEDESPGMIEAVRRAQGMGKMEKDIGGAAAMLWDEGKHPRGEGGKWTETNHPTMPLPDKPEQKAALYDHPHRSLGPTRVMKDKQGGYVGNNGVYAWRAESADAMRSDLRRHGVQHVGWEKAAGGDLQKDWAEWNEEHEHPGSKWEDREPTNSALQPLPMGTSTHESIVPNDVHQARIATPGLTPPEPEAADNKEPEGPKPKLRIRTPRHREDYISAFAKADTVSQGTGLLWYDQTSAGHQDDDEEEIDKRVPVYDDGWVYEELNHQLDDDWLKYSPDQIRDAAGKWTAGFGRGSVGINYKGILKFSVPAVIIDVAAAYFGIKVVEKALKGVALTAGLAVGAVAGVLAVEAAAPGVLSAGLVALARKGAMAAAGGAAHMAGAGKLAKATAGNEPDVMAILLSHMSVAEVEQLKDTLLSQLTEDQQRELAILIQSKEQKLAKIAEHPEGAQVHADPFDELNHRVTRDDIEFFLSMLTSAQRAELARAVHEAFAAKLAKGFDPEEARDAHGKWTIGGALAATAIVTAAVGAVGIPGIVLILNRAYLASHPNAARAWALQSVSTALAGVTLGLTAASRFVDSRKLAKGMKDLTHEQMELLAQVIHEYATPEERSKIDGTARKLAKDYNPDEARDDHGRWTHGGAIGAAAALAHDHPAAAGALGVAAGSGLSGAGLLFPIFAAYGVSAVISGVRHLITHPATRAAITRAAEALYTRVLARMKIAKGSPDQPRDDRGRWLANTAGGVDAPQSLNPDTHPIVTIDRLPNNRIDPMPWFPRQRDPGPHGAQQDTFAVRFGDESVTSTATGDKMRFQHLDPDPSTNFMPTTTPESFQSWTGKPVTAFAPHLQEWKDEPALSGPELVAENRPRATVNGTPMDLDEIDVASADFKDVSDAEPVL